MVIDKGNQHEDDYLTQLRDDGHHVEDIDPFKEGRSRDEAIARTREAMRRGDEYIYQAALDLPGWYGIADFLEWKELPAGETSNLGNYIYEPIDTKLARNEAKPHHALQLSVYARALEAIQGRPPEFIYIQLAREHDAREAIRLSEIDAYCAGFVRQLEEFVADPPETEPYPVSHCSFCDFQKDCEQWWQDTDHLTQVAGINRSQVDALKAAGVFTMAELAAKSPDDPPTGIKPLSYRRIQEQAALQDRSRDVNPGDEERTVVDSALFSEGYDAAYGFRRLPAPHPSDVILDLEGHPLWTPKEGLVFLFGYLADFGQGMEYRRVWVDEQGDQAAMKAAEKAAFEEFMDFLVEHRRGEEHVGWHLYHYGHAETTMLKQLSQRHGTRELELDHLLTYDLMVDLATIVRQAVRIGVDSYSLKKVEKVAGFTRQQTLSKGAAAVIEYEHWLHDGLQQHLDDIEHYNAQDCWATLAVRDWLEALRPAGETYAGKEEKPVALPSDNRVKRLDLRERVLARFPSGSAEALAAELIPYHQREQRPEWWAYFARTNDMTTEDLIADSEAIGGLVEAKDIPRTTVLQSKAITFGFEPQEHKMAPTTKSTQLLWPDRTTSSVGEILEVDSEQGVLRLKLGPKPEQALDQLGNPVALIPGKPLPTENIESAIANFVDAFTGEPLEVGDTPRPRYPALDQLLRREPPRLRGTPPGAEVQTTELGEILRLVEMLDGGALVVQGPPGAGKTWTGARMALHLIAKGHRVAITATAHKAIDNMIKGIEEAAREAGMAAGSVAIARQEGGDPADLAFAVGSPVLVTLAKGADLLADPAPIVAGTAWPLTGAGWDINDDQTPDEQKIDYLMVDEAGQVSLAVAIACGTCARNVILLGDPLQLPQIAKGMHPEGAGESVLTHYLGENRTVPSTHGLFLEESWRMHPVICDFVSSRIYEGRLRSEADCSRQSVGGRALLHFEPVPHTGNGSRSVEEAQRIARWVADLIGKPVVDRKGKSHDLDPEDIMVVTPYNAQIRELESILPAGVRVGTVNKFQGQEAPVVFYSMATSDADSMPRSTEFLFVPNRLNVAVSRAQTVAIVVASPSLLSLRVATVEQMRDVSLLCALPQSRSIAGEEGLVET